MSELTYALIQLGGHALNALRAKNVLSVPRQPQLAVAPIHTVSCISISQIISDHTVQCLRPSGKSNSIELNYFTLVIMHGHPKVRLLSSL